MLAMSSAEPNALSSKVKLPTTITSTPRCNHSEPDEEKPRRGRRRLFHDEAQRKARRKAQCKLNQRSYRARQKGRISTLSLETEGLNDHLQDLRDYQEFLKAYFLPDYDEHEEDVRPMLVVKYFFWAFRVGFALSSAESSALQERFIRLVAVPDVIAQGAMTNGIDALLLQLKRYTSCHGSFEMREDEVKVVCRPRRQAAVGPGDEIMWIVQARGSLKLRVSRDTLMLVFPHVLRDHDTLAQQVVGQTIEPAFSSDFYFNANAKVTKLDQRTDFTGAFYRLLGRTDDVLKFMEGALISPFSELGFDPQGTTIRASAPRRCKQLSLKFILTG